MIAKVYLTTNAQEVRGEQKHTFVELVNEVDWKGEKKYFAEPIYDKPDKVDKYLDSDKVIIQGYFKEF